MIKIRSINCRNLKILGRCNLFRPENRLDFANLLNVKIGLNYRSLTNRLTILASTFHT